MQPGLLADIEEYWRVAASRETDDDGLRPTARDPNLQTVVEAAIEKWIWPQARILDIGCGDGLSTIRFAKRAGSAVGLDYMKEFVERAKANCGAAGLSNLVFDQANVLDLSNAREKYGLADIAVTIRCLINLPDWQHHIAAIEEIARCIRPGGLYLASEGWSEGWHGLNLLRVQAGLEPLQLVRYNALMSRQKFEDAASRHFEVLHYENLGFYLVLSRVVQPVLVHPEKPEHRHPLNGVAAQLTARGIGRSEFSEADYAGVYVLRRK